MIDTIYEAPVSKSVSRCCCRRPDLKLPQEIIDLLHSSRYGHFYDLGDERTRIIRVKVRRP